MDIEIVSYQSKYQRDFRALNEAWISMYFKMEAADYKALDDPEGYIIAKGGYVFMALLDKEPVGACALIKMNDPLYDFELAKMAVSPKVQGKNIGWQLAQVAIETAKQRGSKRIYLETNSILKPALALYKKLGFVPILSRPSPYERADVMLELVLDDK